MFGCIVVLAALSCRRLPASSPARARVLLAAFSFINAALPALYAACRGTPGMAACDTFARTSVLQCPPCDRAALQFEVRLLLALACIAVCWFCCAAATCPGKPGRTVPPVHATSSRCTPPCSSSKC
jgi:hypothetical protein